MFIERSLKAIVENASATFPVLMLTGPRQVGKTTLLRACAASDRKYVTLDDIEQRQLAKNDPRLFLQLYPPPVIIDEVQYAPELFSYIKMQVDESQTNGAFWLTGSQKFHLMQGITESLAGRVAIIDMLGLSQRELNPSDITTSPFIPDPQLMAQWQAGASHLLQATIHTVFATLWMGAFPKLRTATTMSRDLFYSSYVQTYIQRDVKALARVGDELAFNRFLTACAARTAQLVNIASLSRDVDVNEKTIRTWLSILEASGLIYLLQPYSNNVTKRIIKTPKLYFLDTGLCAYLTRWSSAEALSVSAMAGAMLETYVLSEILKSYWHVGKAVNMYFYRDKEKREIDFIIEQDDQLFPIECKLTASPKLSMVKSFRVLQTLGRSVGTGAIVCLRPDPIMLNEKVVVVPVSCI